MSYSQLYLQNKGPRVPIPLAAFFVLVLTVVFGRYFLLNNAQTSKASKKTVKKMEVTNLSPVQANIYWQTEVPEEGFVFYGEALDKVRNIAIDDRDLPDKKGLYTNHYVTLRNLKPGQPYFFKIVANKGEIIVKPDGSVFSFKTPLSSSTASILSPANGKILKENLGGLENAVVILYMEGFSPLSAMTKSTGEWLIPLNSFYDSQKLESRVVSETQKTRVEIFSEDGKTSKLEGRISNLMPVTTTVIIGKSYNLSDSGSEVLSAQSGGSVHKDVDIIYPVEGALIPGRAPLIKGTAYPKSQVFVTVNSRKTFSAVVTADLDGLWSYSLPESLELGNHTVTIKTKNKEGKEVALSRKFVIIANDYEGKVLGEASGSPTLAVTSTPIPTFPPPTSAVVTPPTSITPTALMNTGFSDILPIIGGVSFVVVGLGFLLVF